MTTTTTRRRRRTMTTTTRRRTATTTTTRTRTTRTRNVVYVIPVDVLPSLYVCQSLVDCLLLYNSSVTLIDHRYAHQSQGTRIIDICIICTSYTLSWGSINASWMYISIMEYHRHKVKQVRRAANEKLGPVPGFVVWSNCLGDGGGG